MGVLKTEGVANVNEWKIMFDPYIEKCFVAVWCPLKG